MQEWELPKVPSDGFLLHKGLQIILHKSRPSQNQAFDNIPVHMSDDCCETLQACVACCDLCQGVHAACMELGHHKIQQR